MLTISGNSHNYEWKIWSFTSAWHELNPNLYFTCYFLWIQAPIVISNVLSYWGSSTLVVGILWWSSKTLFVNFISFDWIPPQVKRFNYTSYLYLHAQNLNAFTITNDQDLPSNHQNYMQIFFYTPYPGMTPHFSCSYMIFIFIFDFLK